MLYDNQLTPLEMYNFLLTTHNPPTQNNRSKYLFTKINSNVTA